MIETRANADGTTSYRAKVRMKGYSSQTATFARKTDAKERAKQTEIAIKEGKYFKTAEAKKHTFKELADRYLEYVELRNAKRHPWVKMYFDWWVEQLGDYALSDINKTLIIEQRTTSTVNCYMTALSHAYTTAINEWEWVEEHPMKKIAKLAAIQKPISLQFADLLLCPLL